MYGQPKNETWKNKYACFTLNIFKQDDPISFSLQHTYCSQALFCYLPFPISHDFFTSLEQIEVVPRCPLLGSCFNHIKLQNNKFLQIPTFQIYQIYKKSRILTY